MAEGSLACIATRRLLGRLVICYRTQKHRINLLIAIVWLASTGTALAQDAEGIATTYVDGSNAAVIAFLPSSVRNTHDASANEARAHLESAIENARRCLGEDDVSYGLVFADRIVIRRRGRDEAFDVMQFAPLSGAILVRPGFNARIIFAGGGPEALEQLLPSTASNYFERSCMEAN